MAVAVVHSGRTHHPIVLDLRGLTLHPVFLLIVLRQDDQIVEPLRFLLCILAFLVELSQQQRVSRLFGVG